MALARNLTPPPLEAPLAAVAVVEEAAAQPTLLMPLVARVAHMAAEAEAAEELYSQVEALMPQGPTAQVAHFV